KPKVYNGDAWEILGSGAGGGSGGINLNTNPNASENVDNESTDGVGDYISTGAGVTVAKTTTEADLPLWGPLETGIKLTFAAGTGHTVRLRFRVPPAMRNKKIAYWHFQNPDSYVAETAKMELYSYSDNY